MSNNPKDRGRTVIIFEMEPQLKADFEAYAEKNQLSVAAALRLLMLEKLSTT